MATIAETNQPEGMKQIMQIMGLDPDLVTGFELKSHVDCVPTVTVTRYIEKNKLDGPITQKFRLEPIE